jgi:hypothetical protein
MGFYKIYDIISYLWPSYPINWLTSYYRNFPPPIYIYTKQFCKEMIRDGDWGLGVCSISGTFLDETQKTETIPFDGRSATFKTYKFVDLRI